MEKKITLKEFWESNKELAIHCDTEEKANELLKAFDAIGEKWNSGNAYSIYSNWDLFEDDTCYDNHNSYGIVEDYDTIYEFEEVDLYNTENKAMTDLFQEMKDFADEFFEKASAMLGVKEEMKEKVWEFTEEEKVILRSLDLEWKYIAKDKTGSIYLYTECPIKEDDCGVWDDKNLGETFEFANFKELFNVNFNTIQWEDEEPCEFRKYI